MPVYKDAKRGTWYYSIYYVDIYGKGKRKVKRGFKTRKECKIAESEQLRTLKPNDSNVKTFDEVFHERIAYADLSPRTASNRREQYRKYIEYNFAQLPINKITVAQVKDFRKQLIKNEELSDEYKKTVFSGFKAIMSYALKNQYIDFNPALAVENIKFTKQKFLYIPRDEFDARVYKMDELDNKNPVLYRKLIQLLFYTGLRIGEALPLTWNDWDAINNELNINKSVDSVSNKVRIGTAKTKSSLSTVPVPQFIADMLNELKEEAASSNYYIFGGKKHIAYDTINASFKAVFKEYDPKITLHTLRHSYASYLINNGIDMYVLMHLMRHASIQETIGTYSHLYTDSKQKAMRLFEQ